MGRSNIRVGTSGWSYDHWIGDFYPADVNKGQLLSHYVKRLNTVELNRSFYSLPKAETVEKWRDEAPSNFLFSCKASRYITHMKKLKDPQRSIERFLDTVDHFGKKLGPLLFQLPPNWKVNPDRLESFLEALPDGRRYTFELRDKSWLCDSIYRILQKHGASLCFYDYKGYRSPEAVTADFIYIRLHGPHEEAYTGSYDGRTLAGYARKMQRWADEGKDVFCYFDNDQKACAPQDAARLLESLEKQAAPTHTCTHS